MNREEVLVRVADGEVIKGYKVIETGIDKAGKYKLIETPEGATEKVYYFTEEETARTFTDRYNELHTYRRKNDHIVLYYNTKQGEMIVLAVKEGDDLNNPPFRLQNSLVVKPKMYIEGVLKEEQGICPITEENLHLLQEKGILTEQLAKVLWHNRKNVGFYL